MGVKLPGILKEPMRLYREAGAPLPKEFTWWHQKLAETDLRRRSYEYHTNPWAVLSDHGLVAEGWGIDGFKVKQVVVAINHGQDKEHHGWAAEIWQIHTLRWDESGAWFEKSDGWKPFAEILPGVERDVRLTIPLNWTEKSICESMLSRL